MPVRVPLAGRHTFTAEVAYALPTFVELTTVNNFKVWFMKLCIYMYIYIYTTNNNSNDNNTYIYIYSIIY